MYRYRVFGLNIESDLEFEGLEQEIINDDIDVEIKQGGIREELLEIPEFEKQSTTADYWYFSDGKGICVRELSNGVFHVEDGKTIRYELFPGYNTQSIRQLILCISMAILRAQRGLISIHGSCIYSNDRSYIISGDSGAGKSTFTTELLKHGTKYLSDDICAITFEGNTPYVQSSFPQRKLCEDAIERFGYDASKLTRMLNIETGKYLVHETDRFRKEAVSLNGLIVIKPDDCEEVKLKEIVGAEKLKYVIDNILNLELYSVIGNEKDMYHACMQVAQSIPIYELHRPRNKETIEQMLKSFNDLETNEVLMI